MDDLQRLKELQDADLEAQAVEEELTEARRKLSDEGDLPKIKNQLARLEAGLEDRSARHRSAEREIDRLVGIVKDLDRRLYDGSVTTPRELDAMREQREFAGSQRSESEDSLLELMVEIEDYERARGRHIQAIDRLSSAREKEIADLTEAVTRLEASLAELTSLRQEYTQGLPAILLARYESLRRSRGGRAVAGLDGRVCAVCRVELPVGDLARAKSGHEVVQCNSCRRIVYAG